MYFRSIAGCTGGFSCWCRDEYRDECRLGVLHNIGLSIGQGVTHGPFLGVGMGVVKYIIVGVV